eukprot:6883579-Pyramimonas_sp.AAC.1
MQEQSIDTKKQLPELAAPTFCLVIDATTHRVDGSGNRVLSLGDAAPPVVRHVADHVGADVDPFPSHVVPQVEVTKFITGWDVVRIVREPFEA